MFFFLNACHRRCCFGLSHLITPIACPSLRILKTSCFLHQHSVAATIISQSFFIAVLYRSDWFTKMSVRVSLFSLPAFQHQPNATWLLLLVFLTCPLCLPSAARTCVSVHLLPLCVFFSRTPFVTLSVYRHLGTGSPLLTSFVRNHDTVRVSTYFLQLHSATTLGQFITICFLRIHHFVSY